MRGTLQDIFLGIIAIAMLVIAFFISHDTTATIEKVLIGFSYTIVFFILIEHIPNRIKQKRYAELIRQELIFGQNILENLIKTLGITEENIEKKTKAFLLNSPQPIRTKQIHEATLHHNKAETNRVIQYSNVGELMDGAQKKMKQLKRRLEKFTFFVESELLEIIIDIEKFHLSRCSEILKTKPITPVVEELLPEFEHLLDLEKEIRKYLQKNKK